MIVHCVWVILERPFEISISFICPSACLSAGQSHLFVCLFVCSSVCLSVCLSLSVSVCLCLSLSVSVCLCLSLSVSVCLSVCLSIYLSDCAWLCLIVSDCVWLEYNCTQTIWYFLQKSRIHSFIYRYLTVDSTKDCVPRSIRIKRFLHVFLGCTVSSSYDYFIFVQHWILLNTVKNSQTGVPDELNIVSLTVILNAKVLYLFERTKGSQNYHGLVFPRIISMRKLKNSEMVGKFVALFEISLRP